MKLEKVIRLKAYNILLYKWVTKKFSISNSLAMVTNSHDIFSYLHPPKKETSTLQELLGHTHPSNGHQKENLFFLRVRIINRLRAVCGRDLMILFIPPQSRVLLLFLIHSLGLILCLFNLNLPLSLYTERYGLFPSRLHKEYKKNPFQYQVLILGLLLLSLKS